MNRAAKIEAFGAAVISGWADFGAIYTWRTWTLGWLVRVVAQVAFFALIGLLLGSSVRVEYLLIGNAVSIAAVESFFACASTVWERQMGTLPLFVASPSSVFIAFSGRSLFWTFSGTASSSLALAILAPVMGISLSWQFIVGAVPLLALISISVYGLALCAAACVIRTPELRNVVGNLGHLTLMLICGVQVPTTYWPEPVQWISAALPMTRGLHALRGLNDGLPAGEIAAGIGGEIAVGLVWFVVAAILFRRFVEHGRVTGRIEFGA